MIGFEIEINGKKEYIIIARERWAISIGVHWQRSMRNRILSKKDGIKKNNPPFLFIIGVNFPENNNSTQEHDFSMDRPLSIKDRVKIKVIEFKNVDDLQHDTLLINLNENSVSYKPQVIHNELEKSFISYLVGLNATNLCTAGVGQFGQLVASIDWSDEALENEMPCIPRNGKVGFQVCGNTSSLDRNKETYRSWIKRDLVIGDEISIFILFSIFADKPTRDVKMGIELDD